MNPRPETVETCWRTMLSEVGLSGEQSAGRSGASRGPGHPKGYGMKWTEEDRAFLARVDGPWRQAAGPLETSARNPSKPGETGGGPLSLFGEIGRRSGWRSGVGAADRGAAGICGGVPAAVWIILAGGLGAVAPGCWRDLYGAGGVCPAVPLVYVSNDGRWVCAPSPSCTFGTGG